MSLISIQKKTSTKHVYTLRPCYWEKREVNKLDFVQSSFSHLSTCVLVLSLFWGQLLFNSHLTCIMSTFLQRLIIFQVLSLCSSLGTSRPLQDDEGIPAIAKYFNTKGRYEEVNPYLREDILAVNRSILQPPSAQCREIYLLAVIRHGTRYPTTKNIKDMQRLYNIILHNATGQDRWLQEIQSHWRMWYVDDMDGRLVQKGVDDLKHLAVRLSRLFPSMVSHEKLRNGFFKILTSSKHRCVDSTLAFKAGLLDQWAITGTVPLDLHTMVLMELKTTKTSKVQCLFL